MAPEFVVRPVSVAVLVVARVKRMRLADVGLDVALAEGLGFTSIAESGAGHEQFWTPAEVRAELGSPGFTSDDELVVVTW